MVKAGTGPECPPQQPEEQRTHPQLLRHGCLQGQTDAVPGRGGTAAQGDVVETGDGEEDHQHRHLDQTEESSTRQLGQRRPRGKLGGLAAFPETDGEGVAAEGGCAGDQSRRQPSGAVS
jgi:hypothetical protein